MRNLVFFSAVASGISWELLYLVTDIELFRWVAYGLLVIGLLAMVAQLVVEEQNHAG